MPRRYKFTASEYADMIFVYGECHGNANLAIQKYRERYGNSRICPARETILNAFQRIRENQCLVPLDSASPRASRQNVGRPVKEDSSEESGEESEEEDGEGGEEEDVEGGEEEDVEGGEEEDVKGGEEEVIGEESDTPADKTAKRPPTEPKSKRGRPAAAVGKGRKAAVAKASAKATPAKRKAPTPPGTKNGGAKPVGRPVKEGKKASSEESGEGSEEEDKEGVEEEVIGEESDTPADKTAKRPPTDEEIKEYVKQILEGANLDHITMKMVCEQVYSHYPDFDLAHKKEFIRATVKSCIKGEE